MFIIWIFISSFKIVLTNSKFVEPQTLLLCCKNVFVVTNCYIIPKSSKGFLSLNLSQGRQDITPEKSSGGDAVIRVVYFIFLQTIFISFLLCEIYRDPLFFVTRDPLSLLSEPGYTNCITSTQYSRSR